MFIRFDRIQERDEHTDGQTDRQIGTGRAYAYHRAVARQKFSLQQEPPVQTANVRVMRHVC